MKILIAWIHQVLGRAGGVQRVMINLANAMQARGHDVVLVHYSTGEYPFFFPIHNGIRCINLADAVSYHQIKPPVVIKIWRESIRLFDREKALTINEKFKIRRMRKSIWQIISEEKPDIIIGEDIETVTVFLQSIRPKRIPTISMNHMAAGMIWQSMTKLDKFTMQQCSAVQFLMPSDCEKFNRFLPGIKSICIPNVVPRYYVQQAADNYVIINVARLDRKQKRQHLLIEAFAKIASQFPQWRLEFWGEEQQGCKYTNELKGQITKYKLGTRILLHNNTSDIVPVYRHASVFAFPSAYEGFPLAMTEAMSAGLPIVAYRSCPAVNELVKDGESGLLVEDGVDALAEGLKKLIENEELRKHMGRTAHEAMKEFAPEKIWDQWEALMKDVIAKQYIAN